MTERIKLIPTRASLLGRLNAWSKEDRWHEFFEAYWKPIYRTALQSGLSDTEAKDVVQETVIAVCRNIASFQYRAGMGSFKSWLLRLTHWRIVNHYRRQPHVPGIASHPPTHGGESLAELPAAPPETEELWNREWEKNLTAAAIERVRLQADSRQFQIFDLCTIQNWPIARIAQTLQVHRVTIYFANRRIAAMIRREARHLDEFTPRRLHCLL